MDSRFVYAVSADVLLVSHVLFVLFIVAGLALVLVGKSFEWTWVRNPWFRTAHLVAMAVVALQSWFGVICPLTTWEMALRERAGDVTYSGSFVAHWLDAMLYYQAPAWVFAVGYTLFAVIVVSSWFWVRPRPFSA